MTFRFMVINSDKEIQDAIDNGDWVSAFATAVSYFEHYGARIIKKRSESLEIPRYKDIVKNMSASSIILILRLLDLVDGETYDKMRKILQERNKLIHPERGGIGYRYRKQRTRAVELLEDAKQCIHRIREVSESQVDLSHDS